MGDVTLTLRSMTDTEYAAFLGRLLPSYAADIAEAKGLSAEAARADASKQLDELLADGTNTSGQLLYTAVDDDEAVGVLWLSTAAPSGTPAGWVYDIEVDESQRGKGYGRQIMLLAEQECRRHGLGSLRLHVFGSNLVARQLYESLGYEITSQTMAKRLD